MAEAREPMSGSERSLRAVNPALASTLYDYESIADFKTRIDDLITKLNESPAGARNVAAEPVARTQFGGGGELWREASSVFGSYGTVLAKLKELSGILGDCLEGMGIAVVAASDGFAQVDEENRRRMAAIFARTHTAKEAAEKAARREHGADGSERVQPEQTASDTTLGE
ncbi:hypothetical protein [Streptomyces sp. NBC_01216]|uniref:hypothetical protein n=1 Tax=unclassified Streptomyces TaxID=2593676 RepID=UPI002E14D5B1|nr:hypothetical protein OG393_20380 [Streptomyces sp. NBC_01216]